MHKTIFLALSVLGMIGCSPESDIPYLQEKEGHATRFIVNGKPMLLLAGEPLNSTGSYPARLDEVLAEMSEAHYNTALVAISWQMIEPEEGRFDFSLVEKMLDNARKNDIKIGLLWFGSWKNGISPYAPSWVLRDTERFKRVITPEGDNSRTLSPLCEETKKCDAKAFTELMTYLSDNDEERTIIVVQVENEIGVLGQTRDFSQQANTTFTGNVPEMLISYMNENKETIEIELLEKWKENGFKTSGSWTEVFGENSYTDLFFMAWVYSSYVNYVAEKGRGIYPLPMYVNCWMSQKRPQPLLPGRFPSGGPVLAVLDIWKAGAPVIDFISPDIYDDRTFYQHPKDFHRPDNPLFIPEMHMQEGRATFVFAEHDAMGISPFGLDGHADIISKEYEFLEMMMPVILQYQGTGKMHGFMRWNQEDSGCEFKIDDDVTVVIDYTRRTTRSATPPYVNRDQNRVNLPPAYGIFIQTGDTEFIVAGLNLYVSAKCINPEKEVWLNNAREGYFDDEGNWNQSGIRNGDEAGFLSFSDPHYSIGRYEGYHQAAVGSTTIPAAFKFEVIKYEE